MGQQTLLCRSLLLAVFADQGFGAGDGAGLGFAEREFAVFVEVVEVDDGVDRFRGLVDNANVVESCNDFFASEEAVAVGVDEVKLLLKADHFPSDDSGVGGGLGGARGDE